MTIAAVPSVSTQPLLLDVSNTTLTVTPEQFDRLCIDNPDLRLELTPNSELIVMAPTFSISGKRNLNLGSQVYIWNEQTELGEAFDSSSGYDFTAIGGGKPSPDVSWIEKSRLEGVSLDQLCPVVPDFVIELRSTKDNLNQLQKKMKEYQRLGVRLGLLINPKDRQVEIYRLKQEPELLESPISIDCNEVMPGFVLSMNKIF
ncbi:Uma2 family endonuclease [Chamaesiphon sp. VAR_69_metabat_338]|uniref:Uma2 family endonuclease n=1 Tax=Chamaesiphon sp. VAR_69_metabat_338 TaxID=2964704 RepID=UPI00286D7491|nr:Uma2 family endonuclease [Chamaesiphon sp. VAR_69_metabat_338]